MEDGQPRPERGSSSPPPCSCLASGLRAEKLGRKPYLPAVMTANAKLQKAVRLRFCDTSETSDQGCDVTPSKYLGMRYPDPAALAALIAQVEARVAQVSPQWQPPLNVWDAVPASAGDLQSVEGWLHISKFGFSADAGIRGEPKLIFFLERVMMIIEQTYRGTQNPVQPVFEAPPPKKKTNNTILINT